MINRRVEAIPDSGISDMEVFERKELGLYIHIPFCVRKCEYCDFLSALGTSAMKSEYIDALLTEINSYYGRTSEYTVSSIFIGGGTPSCIPESDIARIMMTLRQIFSLREDTLEATIEVNPGTITADKLITYKNAGINRISFGLQSTNNSELKRLGRIHSYEEFLENYQLAREVGFQNINIDLMSALPGQTVASWEDTLRTVAELEPEHISAYSLIIEEGTHFFERYRSGAPYEQELPDEDTDRRIYYKTKEILEQYGYHRYEISNYAKVGKECRHNNSYWIGTEYLGLGLGSASLLNGVRFSNIRDIKQYLEHSTRYQLESKANITTSSIEKNCISIEEDLLAIRVDQERLTREDQMEEFMFLGLRRCEGVKKDDFFIRFGVSIDKIYGDVLLQLEKKQLIVDKDNRICLTEYGIDISNSVLSLFLLN